MKQQIDTIGLATLIGVVAVLVISFSNMRDVDRLDRVMGERLIKLEGQLAQVASRPAAPAAPSQGVDPNRIYTVSITDSPSKGPANAPVTIAEFSDFQCPFCGKVEPTLKQIEQVYKGKVRIVWKHLPLPFHKNAMPAALAAEAARSQGKFWEMHEKLFANQSALDLADLRKYASELGLNMAQFDKDLADIAKKKRIDDDAAEARALGITGTPGFIINGRLTTGAKPFEAFASMIDEELTKKGIPVPPKAGAE